MITPMEIRPEPTSASAGMPPDTLEGVASDLWARLEEGDSWAVEPLSIYYGLPETLRFVLKGTDEEIRLHASRLKDLVPQPGRNATLNYRLIF